MKIHASIKSRLFRTVAAIVLLSSAFMGFYAYRDQSGQLLQRFKDLPKNENRLFETLLDTDAQGLGRALAGLSRLEPLLTLLAAGNRDALQQVALPIFD